MADWDEFRKTLKTEVLAFAESRWKTYENAAVADGKAFIEKAESDLESWTTMLAKGDLNQDEFEWLMAGKKDLADLVALKQQGLSKAALDKFVNGLIDTIVATAFKTVL